MRPFCARSRTSGNDPTTVTAHTEEPVPHARQSTVRIVGGAAGMMTALVLVAVVALGLGTLPLTRAGTVDAAAAPVGTATASPALAAGSGVAAGLPGGSSGGSTHTSGGLPGGPSGSGGSGSAGGSAQNGLGAPGGVGSVRISPIGHPSLCWETHGPGSAVTLQQCDAALQEQQWSLTAAGILINGAGYCLEGAGTPVGGGSALYVDFAHQCAGTAGQRWRYSGTTSRISAPRVGVCAEAAGGALVAGTQIVRARCGTGTAAQRWSLGFSDVGLTGGHGHGRPGGRYVTTVAVANTSTTATADGVTVTLRPGSGLRVTGLRGVGGAHGWSCDVARTTCSGSLAADAKGDLDVSGRMPRQTKLGTTSVVVAHLTVTGSNQTAAASHTTADASVTASTAAVPELSTGDRGGKTTASATGGGLDRHLPAVAAVVAAIGIVGGALLLVATRRGGATRRRKRAARHRGGTEAPAPRSHASRSPR